MWMQAAGYVLRGAVRQLGRVPPARWALERLNVAGRGAGVAILRCRRLVPDDEAGRAHADRKKGAALTPAELDQALDVLGRQLRFVHLGEALAVLSRGQRLHEGLAVLTFDESFAATTELALSVCEAHGVPASFFVTTGHLEEPTTLWDEEVRGVVDAVAPRPLAVSFVDRALQTRTGRQRAAAVHRLLLALAARDEAELAARLDELRGIAGGRPAVRPLDRMLTTAALQVLARHPLAAIGAHGHRHLSLAAASDAALLEELHGPRELLARLCGSGFTDVVSYPFGRAPYVDERVVKAARLVGYRAGLTAVPGIARPGDHLFQLPRLPIDRRSGGAHAHALAGTLLAVDELLLAAAGEKDRLEPDTLEADPEG